ncbi:MAG TPA: NUDIX domain-containing protein [Burkholderiales bacterium]|nr:NUDIX domain-containing protein [Burkholderiales bacterium]
MNRHVVPTSAGIVPARRAGSGWKLLILRAYKDWDFPKGHIETGEAPLEAALREAREETGIDDFALEFGDTWCDTLPYSRQKVARYYLAVTRRELINLPVSPELGRPEHQEWRWVDFSEAGSLIRPRLVPVLAWAYERLRHRKPKTDRRNTLRRRRGGRRKSDITATAS